MNNFPIWYILTGIVIIGLVLFYKKGTSWGGLVLGAVVGCVIAIIHNDKGQGFEFIYIKKAAIIGTLIGVVVSLITHIINRSKNKRAPYSTVH